jgi:aspartate racemase
MKLIGLLGGMSYVATPPYYNRLNELVAEQLGSPNSARILTYSVNYARLKNLYHHGWDKIPAVFAEEYNLLAAAKPDCIIMACNTLHKAYDLVESQLPKGIPFFHAVRLTRDYCLEQGVRTALFIGTSFTMSDDYFMRPLREAGIDLTLPTATEQEMIQKVQSEVSQNKITDEQKAFFVGLLNAYPDVDAVILACTELPLIAPASTPKRPIINPAELQCRAAVAFALTP